MALVTPAAISPARWLPIVANTPVRDHVLLIKPKCVFMGAKVLREMLSPGAIFDSNGPHFAPDLLARP